MTRQNQSVSKMDDGSVKYDSSVGSIRLSRFLVANLDTFCPQTLPPQRDAGTAVDYKERERNCPQFPYGPNISVRIKSDHASALPSSLLMFRYIINSVNTQMLHDASHRITTNMQKPRTNSIRHYACICPIPLAAAKFPRTVTSLLQHGFCVVKDWRWTFLETSFSTSSRLPGPPDKYFLFIPLFSFVRGVELCRRATTNELIMYS